jgi:hypothetical protein
MLYSGIAVKDIKTERNGPRNQVLKKNVEIKNPESL